MSSYKKPCNYCGELIDPDSKFCPLCAKADPLGPVRCPKCKNPVEKNFKVCGNCGLPLRIKCPKCGKDTFLGSYCEVCNAPLLVVCPSCHAEQPPIGNKCIKCGKPL